MDNFFIHSTFLPPAQITSCDSIISLVRQSSIKLAKKCTHMNAGLRQNIDQKCQSKEHISEWCPTEAVTVFPHHTPLVRPLIVHRPVSQSSPAFQRTEGFVSNN